MSSRKVRWSGAWVDLAARTASDQYPGALLPGDVTAASSTRGTVTATASDTAHVAGAWVEVDASLSAAADGIYIGVSAPIATNGADTSTIFDIGIGAASLETVWARIGIGYGGRHIRIPGHIAAGTRVAVRIQSVTVSRALTVTVSFLPKLGSGFGSPVTYQADSATSRGLTLTAPGSLNVKGAWTEIVASTAAIIAALAVTPQGAGGTTMNGSGVLIDLAVGAAASEAVVVSDIYLLGSASEFYVPLSPKTYGVNIPAGSRISARYQRAHAGNAVDLILTGTPPA